MRKLNKSYLHTYVLYTRSQNDLDANYVNLDELIDYNDSFILYVGLSAITQLVYWAIVFPVDKAKANVHVHVDMPRHKHIT